MLETRLVKDSKASKKIMSSPSSSSRNVVGCKSLFSAWIRASVAVAAVIAAAAAVDRDPSSTEIDLLTQHPIIPFFVVPIALCKLNYGRESENKSKFLPSIRLFFLALLVAFWRMI
jgi:hypothetical protein